MSWSGAISRRAFLRATTFSAGMLAVSRLRLMPALAVEAAPATDAGLRVLTAREAAILTAIAERVTDTGDAANMPRFRDTDALPTIDTALVQLDAEIRDQFRWALLLFDYGPFLFELRLSRFRFLPEAERDAYIRGWRDSRFVTRRLVYRAMKNLTFLGYYSQDATWEGIHYTGPWVPRARRVLPAA